MHPLVIAIVFVVVAVAELPDKSMFASLVLGTRFPALWVFTGVAAAFLIHVTIAVTAGGLLSLLPHRTLELIVAGMFLAGSAYLFFGKEEEEAEKGEEEAEMVASGSFRRVAFTSFGVVFIGEWGDITQVVTANYAARYHDPLSVGIGATLGLWAVAALAVTAGSKLLDVVDVVKVRRLTGLVLLGFGVATIISALH